MNRKELKKLLDSDQASIIACKTYLHTYRNWFDRFPFTGGMGAGIGNGFREFDHKRFLIIVVEKDADSALAPYAIE